MAAEKITVSGLNEGDKVSITAQTAVEPEEGSKYYVQGIRLSGRDNATVSASIFEVDGDADYVVAYGIKGNQVKYTVKYQDANGKDLMASESFYGNVGDKPVVAYRYIEGYAPGAFGLTKTLSANEAENVFVFVYTTMPSVTVNETVQEETVTTVVQGTAAGGNAGGAGAGTEGAAEAGAPGANENAGEAAEENAAQAEESTEGGNDMIVDLDEEEVPLAESAVEEKAELDSTMKTYVAIIAAGVAALGVIGGVLVALKKKK